MSVPRAGVVAGRGRRRLPGTGGVAGPEDVAAGSVADVLYHRGVADVVQGFSEFRRVLRPGGIALVREPAFDWLRGSHDVGIHTERRLTVGDLRAGMRRAGFDVLAGTYANMVLLPLAVAKRTAERWLGMEFPPDLTVPSRPVNTTLESILTLESLVARSGSLPVGLSAFALGRA